MRNKELSPRIRAGLFSALLSQHPEQEGWDRIFQLLGQGQRMAGAAQLPEVAEQMAEGQAMAVQSLRDTGKFFDWELAVLEVGLATGDVRASYRRLRDHYLQQGRFAATLRQQLMLPAAFVGLVLGLMYGWLAYVGLLTVGWAALSWLLAMLALALVMIGALSVVRRSLAGFVSPVVAGWLRRVPVLSGTLRSAQLLQFFNSMQQAVAADLPLAQALKLAARKIPDRHYGDRFMAVHRGVADGAKLSTALAQSGVLKGVTIGPLLAPGAGPREAMEHLTRAVHDHYLRQLDLVARFMPVILFGLLPLVALIQVLLL